MVIETSDVPYVSVLSVVRYCFKSIMFIEEFIVEIHLLGGKICANTIYNFIFFTSISQIMNLLALVTGVEFHLHSYHICSI